MGSFRAFLVLLAAWVVGATVLLRVLLGTVPAAPANPAAATFDTDAAGNVAPRSFSFGISTVPPQIGLSPAGGTYATAQTVILCSNESGARLYYTQDGSEPTTASIEYRGPFVITSSVTLKVLGVDPAGNRSYRSAVYRIVRTEDPPPPTR